MTVGVRVYGFQQCELTNGKIHPRTGHEGPKWELTYSSTLSLTSVQDWDGWSMPLPPP